MTDYSWLPAILDPHGIRLERKEDFYFSAFNKIFQPSLLIYQDYSFVTKKTDDPKYAEKVFWHLVTRDKSEYNRRLLDTERANRLFWIPSILQNSTKIFPLPFDFLEHGKSLRTYFWLKEIDYLLIIAKNEFDRSAELITSFCITSKSFAKKIEEKYHQRIC